MNYDILQIAPTFLEGAKKLHAILSGVTIVCALCGLTIIVFHASQEKHLTRIWPMFVRMGAASFLLTGLGTWGDMFNGAMADLVSQIGWGQFPGSVASDYQAAIAKKWGSASVQVNNQNVQNGAPIGSSTNRAVTLTHYGYEQPGDANYDSNSAQGIGAFEFDDTPGSLQNINASGVLAAGLSADVVQLYGLKPGQEFSVQTASGQSLNLVYADNTATTVPGTTQPLTGRIDVYDPQNTFALDGAQVTSVAGGAVIEGSPAVASGGLNVLNPATWISSIVNAIVYLLSIAALVCMIIMTLVQQLLYAIEVTISPIFIGLWLIPGLSNLATRFFTSLAAILLWPLGWVVSDLVTKFFVDWATNPTGGAAQTGLNVAATALSGGTLALGFWVLLALWVIGSSFVAPAVVSALIVTGGSGIGRVFASTVGAGAYSGYSAGRSAAVGAAASAMGWAVPGPSSGAATHSMGARPNYARRPMNTLPPPPTGLA